MAALDQLRECRKITGPEARLACYDRAVQDLDAAESRGDVVVVDREQAQTVRRQAFGFSLPSLSLFDRGERPAALDSVSGVVASARQDATGRWLVRLQDGAAWSQVDPSEFVTPPKPGTPARVRRAALGSYMMTLGAKTAFRVRRVE